MPRAKVPMRRTKGSRKGKGVEIATTERQLERLRTIFKSVAVATVASNQPMGILKQALVSRQTKGK